MQNGKPLSASLLGQLGTSALGGLLSKGNLEEKEAKKVRAAEAKAAIEEEKAAAAEEARLSRAAELEHRQQVCGSRC